MTEIYDNFAHDELELPANPTGSIPYKDVNAVLRKDSFEGNIREGFDIFCLIN